MTVRTFPSVFSGGFAAHVCRELTVPMPSCLWAASPDKLCPVKKMSAPSKCTFWSPLVIFNWHLHLTFWMRSPIVKPEQLESPLHPFLHTHSRTQCLHCAAHWIDVNAIRVIRWHHPRFLFLFTIWFDVEASGLLRFACSFSQGRKKWQRSTEKQAGVSLWLTFLTWRSLI